MSQAKTQVAGKRFTATKPATRIPALEALRSVLLLMGIVVHSAMVLPGFDQSATTTDVWWLQFIYSSVHVWRVPAYFIVSGYLSAALFARGTVWDFLRGRFKRVTSVLLAAQVFIIPVFLLAPHGCTACKPYGGTDWLHVGWLHLWFLYDLVLITHAMVALIWLKRKLPTGAQTFIANAAARFRFGLASLPVLAVFSWSIPGTFGSDQLLRIDFGILPDWRLLGYHSIFFVVGWLAKRNDLLREAPRNLWLGCSIAVALACVTYLPLVSPSAATLYLANLTTWFGAWSVIGLFLAFIRVSKPIWTFLNDAAYWVYLWHAIPVITLTWMLAQLGVNVWLNLLVTSAVTLAVTLLTYRYWVAPTIVGLYLSGRRRFRVEN